MADRFLKLSDLGNGTFDFAAVIEAAPVYTDEEAAITGGLSDYGFYKTPTGELRYKLPSPTPVITFVQPDGMVLDSTDQPLAVASTHDTASVILTSSDEDIATVYKTDSQWYLHVVAQGDITITATQAAQPGYYEALPVSRAVTIAEDGLLLMPTNIYSPRGIPGALIVEAVSDLQTDLQNANLWDDLITIYPGVSITGDLGYLLNLKNPVDSDAAFRAVPAGVIDADADGLITPVDTLVVNSDLPLYSKCMFIYKRKPASGVWIMGAYGGGSFAINYVNSGIVNGSGIPGADMSGGGLMMLDIVSDSVYKLFLNGVNVNQGAPGSTDNDISIAVNGLKQSSGVGFASERAVSLAGIFNRGLNDAEAAALSTIAEAYNTKLKRSYSQVYNRIHFFGDSITGGYGLTAGQYSWAYLLCKLMGWDHLNQSVGGSIISTSTDRGGSVESFAETCFTAVQTKSVDDKFMFLSFGTNEIGSNIGTVQEYKDGIEIVVNDALTKGWSVNDIVITTGFWIGIALTASTRHADFVAGAAEICGTLGITKYFDLTPDMAANGPTDTLHPNAAMNVIMAIKYKRYFNSIGIHSIWES